jgi:ABC-type dipeptide/oligopeptide/nickel transport system ATPase component
MIASSPARRAQVPDGSSEDQGGPILRAEDIWVRVTPRGGSGPVAVVRGASFDVARGETTCLVGESGSGKTILMRAILGITRARPGVTGGRAWLWPRGAPEPRSVLDPAGRRGRRPLRTFRSGWAGYVFQHPHEALDPFRTVEAQVRDSVAVVHPQASATELRERTHAWLDAVRLPDPASVGQLHPHELSGGMAQRVAIAVALGTEPELLVADEPTTGLDWSVRREIVELLGNLCRERGMTLLLISHDIAVVRHMADRVLLMYRGELLEDGPRGAFFEPGPGLHPYAIELQARAEELESGRPDGVISLPEGEPGEEGCRYAHRCPLLEVEPAPEFAQACRVSAVGDVMVAPEHRVRCLARPAGEGT